jgi:hypothetical protein
MPTIIVTLLQANNLPASDFQIGGGGKSDPYVKLQLGSQTFKSTCIQNALDPVWQPAQRYEFEVVHVQKDVLQISVFDQDTWNRDDLLGTVSVPVSRFESQSDQVVSETLALEVPSEYESQKCNATITLEFNLKLDESGPKTLRIWENEHYSPTQGWKPSDSSDRQQWSTFDESRTSAQFEDVAPDVPPNHEPKGWGYSTQRGDAQGWEYASSWTSTWSTTAGTMSFCRRRMWENLCEPN